MELFNKESTSDFISGFKSKLKSEIERLTDEEILGTDIEEWVVYFESKFRIETLQIIENNIDRSMERTKIQQYNHFYDAFAPYEPKYYSVDGIIIKYKIAFWGNAKLLYLHPTTYRTSRFDTETVSEPTAERYGYFIIELEFTNSQVEQQKEKLNDYVQSQFASKFDNYKCMVEYVNNDINGYNNGLKDLARSYLEKRHSSASTFADVGRILEIPLTPGKHSTNTKPIKLEQVKRPPIARPKSRQPKDEYSIKDTDYENINNIIWQCGTAMEQSVRTFYRIGEEELRDYLLSTLNTHYENVTGETFRKIGKTDICIMFENKAAFIGECKVWHGEKKFEETVQQVLNYSTWRDNKISIIIFNKENLSFEQILKKINDWVSVNTSSFIREEHNIWKCQYYRKDSETNIELCIMAFDLYADTTQFKDKKKQ